MPAHARYWRVAEELGLGGLRRSSPVAVGRSDVSFAAATLPADGRPRFALVPGARWDTKRWPAEKFARLAVKAYRTTRARPVIVGAPDEIALCGEVTRLIDRLAPGCGPVDLSGRTTLRQLAACLARCHLCVSNDTGPMHLAAAVGTPVVGVFTCTDPVRSGPPGRRHELIRTSVPCGGSYERVCPFEGAKRCACFADVQVSAVWGAVSRCLARDGLLAPSPPSLKPLRPPKPTASPSDPVILPLRRAA